MKKNYLSILLVLTTVFIANACKKDEAVNNQLKQLATTPHKVIPTGPKVIIYQTYHDYSKLVPISLSEDKKSVVSYPDIRDVFYNGNLAYPVQLHGGFWLDQRGINKNVAFINLTYQEYSELAKTPYPDELLKMITDLKPLLCMYSCGKWGAYEDIEKELNTMIDVGDFSGFGIIYVPK